MAMHRQAAALAHDVAAAFGLLTRLPVPVDGARAVARGARGAWAFPLVGAVLGLVTAGVATGALAVGLGPMPAAIAAVGVGIMLTGALHEDGLADTADGFWGGWTAERRLEIMKDSRIGAYGVIALVLAVSMKVALVADLIAAGQQVTGLVVAACGARAAMVAVWAALPPARPDGLARSMGRPGAGTAIAAILVALPVFALLSPAAMFWSGGAAALGAGLVARSAARRIGGQTGDVLGAVQQVSEIAILAAVAATLP